MVKKLLYAALGFALCAVLSFIVALISGVAGLIN